MADLNDLEKARERINEIFRLRDEIQKASPILNELKDTLQWYEKVCNEIPEKEESVLKNIDGPIQIVLDMSPSTFNMSYTTGATGSFYAVSGDTRTIIKSYGSKHYHLINEYDEINKTEVLIDRILEILVTFRPELKEFNPHGLLIDAKETYAKWKAGAVSNSDLAKDIRSFQDVFNGAIHRARISTYIPIPKTNPDPSWPKMAKALAKKGSGFLNSLKNQQGEDDKFHLQFTIIMKKTKVVTSKQMDRIFKDYIEHLYSVITLINENLMT